MPLLPALTQHRAPRDLPEGWHCYGNTCPWNLFRLCGLKLFPCVPTARHTHHHHGQPKGSPA